MVVKGFNGYVADIYMCEYTSCKNIVKFLGKVGFEDGIAGASQ